MAWQDDRERGGDEQKGMTDSERVFVDEVMRRWRMMPGRTLVYNPPTDVFETGDTLVVIVEIAGLKEGNFRVALGNRQLTISGTREDPAAKLAYHQMEIQYGQFVTQAHLPWPVEEDSVRATYEEGFLKVVLRKTASRRVPVTTPRGNTPA